MASVYVTWSGWTATIGGFPRFKPTVTIQRLSEIANDLKEKLQMVGVEIASSVEFRHATFGSQGPYVIVTVEARNLGDTDKPRVEEVLKTAIIIWLVYQKDYVTKESGATERPAKSP